MPVKKEISKSKLAKAATKKLMSSKPSIKDPNDKYKPPEVLGVAVEGHPTTHPNNPKIEGMSIIPSKSNTKR